MNRSRASLTWKQPLIVKCVIDLQSARKITKVILLLDMMQDGPYQKVAIHVPNGVYDKIYAEAQALRSKRYHPSIELHHHDMPGGHVSINTVLIYPTHYNI